MFSPQVPIETRMQVALIIIPIMFGLLATIAVALRILARHISNRRLDASDYIMIAALIVTLSFCGLITTEPFTGAGMHTRDIVARFGTSPIVTYTKVRCMDKLSDSPTYNPYIDDSSKSNSLGISGVPTQVVNPDALQQGVHHQGVYHFSPSHDYHDSVIGIRDHPWRVGSMPAFRLQLGPVNTWRVLRRSGALIQNIGIFQCCARCRGPPSAHAIPLRPRASHDEESDPYQHICWWFYVCIITSIK